MITVQFLMYLVEKRYFHMAKRAASIVWLAFCSVMNGWIQFARRPKWTGILYIFLLTALTQGIRLRTKFAWMRTNVKIWQFKFRTGANEYWGLLGWDADSISAHFGKRFEKCFLKYETHISNHFFSTQRFPKLGHRWCPHLPQDYYGCQWGGGQNRHLLKRGFGHSNIMATSLPEHSKYNSLSII